MKENFPFLRTSEFRVTNLKQERARKMKFREKKGGKRSRSKE